MIRALPALAAVMLAGCTFQPGTAFGTLEGATLEARFQPKASRLDESGRLITNTGYRLRIDSLRLVPRQLDFQSTSGRAASGGSFDPANPPPGYSLCHGGHCHRDDGALIDYADIEAELSGGSLKTATVLSLPTAVAFNLLGGSEKVALSECKPGCQLDRGTWSKAVLSFSTLTASGSVEDPTTFDRLGGKSRTWSLTLSPEPLSRTIDVSIDRDQGERLSVAAALTLSEELWDKLDFRTLAASPGTIVLEQDSAARAQLTENLAKSRLDVTVTR